MGMMRLIVLFLVSFLVLDAKPLSLQVSAPSAILINAETGAVLYAKEEHQRSFPASITKIATACYVLEKKGASLHEVVAASPQALMSTPSHARGASPPYRLTHDGTSMGLKVGETVPLVSLLHGLMLISGNDAGNVLAESVSGSIDCFCDDLNQFLKQQGILETHFTNPHGLHHDDHWTTAYDMAQIARLAMKHPAFRDIVKTPRYLKPQTNLQPPQYLVQRNKLLRQGAHYYPKAVGIKTGYHSKAGFTIVAAATHEGRTLIAVVLKCQENNDRFRDVIKLFDAAFSEKKTARTLYASESDIFTHRLKGATDPLKAVLKEDVVLEYYPAEEPQFHAEIEWEATLPLEAGQCVGHLRCVDDKGNALLEKPIFATNSVSKTAWARLSGFCAEHKPLCLALFLGSQVVLLLLYYFKKHQKVGKR
jgi:D-alanyl-D-alanine carboxypeptidase (penicillin-binding protein 5/6)